jgi:hypothetical protein
VRCLFFSFGEAVRIPKTRISDVLQGKGAAGKKLKSVTAFLKMGKPNPFGAAAVGAAPDPEPEPDPEPLASEPPTLPAPVSAVQAVAAVETVVTHKHSLTIQLSGGAPKLPWGLNTAAAANLPPAAATAAAAPEDAALVGTAPVAKSFGGGGVSSGGNARDERDQEALALRVADVEAAAHNLAVEAKVAAAEHHQLADLATASGGGRCFSGT